MKIATEEMIDSVRRGDALSEHRVRVAYTAECAIELIAACCRFKETWHDDPEEAGAFHAREIIDALDKLTA
jgi:hypothetical protein